MGAYPDDLTAPGGGRPPIPDKATRFAAAVHNRAVELHRDHTTRPEEIPCAACYHTAQADTEQAETDNPT